MTETQQLSRSEAMAQVATELTESISFDEFAERVLAIWSSNAKRPKDGIRNDLRHETARYGFVFIDDQRKQLMPLRVGMQGVRLRHIVTEQEVEEQALLLVPSDYAMLPGYNFTGNLLNEFQFLDTNHQPLHLELATVTSTEISELGGEYETQKHGFRLAAWFARHHVQAGDSIIWVVDDWVVPRFVLEHEAAADRNETLIAARNQELVELLYHQLEHASDERIRVKDAIPAAHMRMREPQGYPGDPWEQVVQLDPRITCWVTDIRYATDDDNFLDRLRAGEAEEELEAEFQEDIELPPAEAGRIYQFKCAFKQRKGLWRMIEIQGDQTLEDFNSILVSAFNHEWDHMGGFWQRVRRGNTKRFREVEMGSVAPFGEGDEGAYRQIGEFGLEIGDEIKYVFDLGDWHEHVLKLVSILEADEAEANVDYPRVVAQNKPRYKYCPYCKEAGKKTVATYVCIDCSNEEQREVLACEECVAEFHEDHYVEELVY
ncbi:MAG: hypothetical protein KDE53_03700 [Caldilineaceae bacterium]|nr:hypothetical protein [Caldilineaceae bacterium]